MPLYEYKCEACGTQFEKIQKFSDPLVDVCPKCGKGPVVKLLSSPAIQFKGSGWYITDYAKKSSTGGNTREGKDTKETQDTKDTKESNDTKASPSTSTDSTPKTSS